MFWFRHEQVAWLSPQMPQMRLVMKCASRGSLPFMKMLYPPKIAEVLWHSTPFFWLKSILVEMPRLPTIRVIGSQDISTRPVSSAVVIALPFRWYLGTPGSPALLVAGQQLVALLAPLGLLVGGLSGEAAQRADDRAVEG